MAGCETDSFFDPSKTGRFEYMPTTIPILERIDAIEARERLIQDTTPVTPEDLLSNDLTYRLSPGDMVTVEIPELTQPGTMYGLQRRVDSTGLFRIARIGDVPAAGLTAEELEAEIRARLVPIMADADVSVIIDEGIVFQYTVYGLIRQVGVYPLRKPDLRIREALAMAGGLPDIVTTVYVIRTIPLVPGLEPFPRTQVIPQVPIPPGQAMPSTQPPPVDVEELIRQLDKDKQTAPPQPGVLRIDGEPAIDVDELEPAGAPRQPAVDVDDPTRNASPTGQPAGPDTFVFIEERGEWVRVKRGPEGIVQPLPPPGGAAEPPTMLERIIAIPARNIREGDAAYNIVVRPNDSIYVREPPSGFVYVDGEVIRPGVYSLPPDGKLTMSRLVTAAGGLNPVAIPERVDLTRVVGPNREATLRVNLAGIRRRTEPDVYLKPDDHIIVGTNFLAVPLAVIRSGFRTTYGFGFLLDRNFGNDVFGPPPVNQFGQ
jgi:polysaccharide export outer membrane protein